MSYEDNAKKMDAVIAKLEDKSTGLNEGIALYEEGIALAKLCLDELDAAKGKIRLLQQDVNKLTETAFDLTEDRDV